MNNKIQIENKTFNIDNIDFILLNGKLRVYKSNGTIISLFDGYTMQDKLDTFSNISYSLQCKNANFINLNGCKLININNILTIDRL